MPYQNEYVFSVESNSTITGLAFNSTDWTLSFTASGPSGTTGSTRVTVAKSLIPNLANIAVYVDNNLTDYSITSLDNSWLLAFNYTHSTHQVLVDLNTQLIPEFPTVTVLLLLAPLAIAIGMIPRRRKSSS
jgi:hypothetical protein